MKLFRAIAEWLEERRRDRKAVELATKHFLATTGQRPLHSGTNVIDREQGRRIVRVCYCATFAPPHRAWFAVSDSSRDVTEISWEEARIFGERPWR